MGMDYNDLKIKEDKRWYAYEADDKDVAFKIRYIGSEATCKIAVDATTGDISSEAPVGTADANFLEPGGTAGNIDVSDANADTLGKVVNIIEGLADYECWFQDGLPDETSDDVLLTMAATSAKDTDLALYFDTSVRDAISMGCGAGEHMFTEKGRENIVLLATVGIQTATSAAFNLYLVDDVAGTKTLIATKGAITGGTDLSFAAADLHADGTKSYGKRLVFWAGGTAVAVGTGGSVKTGLFVFKQSTKLEPEHRGGAQHYENW